MKIEFYHEDLLLATFDWPLSPGIADHWERHDGQRYAVTCRTFAGTVSKPTIRLDVIPISGFTFTDTGDNNPAQTPTPPTPASDDGKETAAKPRPQTGRFHQKPAAEPD